VHFENPGIRTCTGKTKRWRSNEILRGSFCCLHQIYTDKGRDCHDNVLLNWYSVMIVVQRLLDQLKAATKLHRTMWLTSDWLFRTCTFDNWGANMDQYLNVCFRTTTHTVKQTCGICILPNNPRPVDWNLVCDETIRSVCLPSPTGREQFSKHCRVETRA
jgi:hypothetical protein